MKLDGVIFTREMLLYFLSCLLVLWAVQNGNLAKAFNNSFSDTQWNTCLSIPWEYSLILVVAYIAYCIIDINFFLLEHCLHHYFPVTAKSKDGEDELHSIPSMELSLPNVYVTSTKDVLSEQNPQDDHKSEKAKDMQQQLQVTGNDCEEFYIQERKSHDM